MLIIVSFSMGDLQRKPLYIERFLFTAWLFKALDATFVKFLLNLLFMIDTLPSNH